MSSPFSGRWGHWLRNGLYALLVLFGLLMLAWGVFDQFFFRPAIFRTILAEMTDVRLTGITLEEAQRRAPFPVCLPTWLPEGLRGPEISFHSEWGAPWASDITLTYWRQGLSVLEIFQAHRPWAWKQRDELNQDLHISYITFALLKWQVGIKEAERLKPNMRGILQQIVEKDKHQYRVYELIHPSEYRAYGVDWWSEQPLSPPPGELDNYGIYYRIFSRLSLSETIRIAEELQECLPVPMTRP